MGCGSLQGRIPEQGYEDTLRALALGYTVSAVLKDHGFQDFFFLYPLYAVHEDLRTK